jgi:ribosomal-protein-alanine N-acetyltransferase
VRSGSLPDGYHLQLLRLADAALVAEAYRRNRLHLAPWEPVRDDSFYTETGQARAIAYQLDAFRGGRMLPWLVMHGDRLAGRMNLNNIVSGVLRSASLGYWVDVDHLRRGVASGAIAEACLQADERGLHRLEAGTMLHNTASQRTLERNGFTAYGMAPGYLFIAGAWQDHRLYQRLLNDRPV